MPVFEKDPEKSVLRLQKRLDQGMVMEVGQMYEFKGDNNMVVQFKAAKRELDQSKEELAGAILREKEVIKRYQRLVKRVHAFYVAAFHPKDGVVASKLLKLVTESGKELNDSISGAPPAAEKKTEDEQSKYHFQQAPKVDWKMSHEWREKGMEKKINESSEAALALAFLKRRSYDRISELKTRLCLLCLSIFPDNFVLKKRLLIYWWIGEGIISVPEPIHDSDPTAEDIGEGIFEELIREGLIVARKKIGNGIPDELIKEGGIVTREDLHDEFFETLLKDGVIVAKEEVGDETIREGVIVARKDYSACPIVNRCSMNPWIRDMLVSVAKDACFFDFDPSGKPSLSFATSLRSCLVSSDLDTLYSRTDEKKNDSTTPPSSSPSTRSFSSSCFPWLVSRQPNITLPPPSNPALKKEDSSSTPSDSSAKSCCSWLASRDPSIPPSSSHALENEDSSGTPSTKSHYQNIPSASSSSLSHDLNKEGSSKDTPLFSFAKTCCSCLVSHNSSRKDVRKQVHAEDMPKEEDLISVFNVSEKILSFEIDWLSKLKKIEVLQLGRWQYWCEHHIEVENDQVFKSLGSQKLLRYLSLRGISRISALPASLSGLVNLQILDLKACHNLETLPDISSLKKLTHLDLSECYLLESMPEGIARLTSLQVLKGFIIGNSASNTRNVKTSKLQDLAKLKKLRRLSIILQSSTVEEDNYKTLNGISSLCCLTITWSPKEPVEKRKKEEPKELTSKQETKEQQPNQEPDVPVSFPLSLPENLTKLDLRGFPLDKIPKWLDPSKLPKLKKLYLSGGKLKRLANGSWGVEILRLKFMKDFSMEFPELKKTFPSMKYLEKIDCCDEDIIWPNGEKEKGRDQDHIVLPESSANKEREGYDQYHNVPQEGPSTFGEITEGSS